MKTKPLKRVALLIESSRAYGRGLLQGIARYLRSQEHWSVFYQECRLGDLPDWLSGWRGDGIIARIENRAMGQAIRRKRRPTVDVRNLLPDFGFPAVDTDHAAIVRLAMDVFLDRGFRAVAFCGFAGADYSDARARHLVDMAREHELPCHVYRSSTPVFVAQSSTTSGTFEYEQHGLVYEQDLEQWLRELPKPIGLLACNDIRGQQVLNACRRLRIAVPDQVAVLGVDNDRVICELATPALSSIDPNAARIGYEAAALLDRLMDGARPPAHPQLVPPARFVQRRSTDVLAVEDRAVAAALRFIRARAFQAVTVDEIARHVGLSRRLLERRFARTVGRAPKAEVIRVRIERAKALLQHTSLPLNLIAEKTGFRHTEHFHSLFKRKVGATPARFRERTLASTHAS